MTLFRLLNLSVCGFAFFVATNGYAQLSPVEPKPKPNVDSMQAIERFTSALETISRHNITPVTMSQILKPCVKNSINTEIRLSAIEAMNPLIQEFQTLDEPNRLVFLKNCLTKVLSALGPYSELINLNSRDPFISRGPAGIGLELETEQVPVRVASVFEGAPAERAGVLAGDEFISIDGVSMTGTSAADLIPLLRGAVASSVELVLKRAGLREPVRLMIKRELIKIKFSFLSLLENDIVYIGVTQLSTESLEQIKTELTGLRRNSQKPFKGIVLDLRLSLGGEFYSSLELAALFLNDEVQIATLVGRTNDHSPQIVRDIRLAQPRYLEREKSVIELSVAKELKVVPMAVLMSSQTASGAEIVAAALQDHGRAKLLGEKSFGKGTIETALPIDRERREAVILTTQQVFRMNKVPLETLGVTPNELIGTDLRALRSRNKKEFDLTSDKALRRAIDILNLSATK
jgi:carboxyl-terminal processing protease